MSRTMKILIGLIAALLVGWLQHGPLGTGEAFVGVVGTEDHVEFTALGDNVNVTARLASAAAGGEILVTDATARAAGSDSTDRLERRRLDLRGKSEATDVFVLTLAGSAAR